MHIYTVSGILSHGSFIYAFIFHTSLWENDCNKNVAHDKKSVSLFNKLPSLEDTKSKPYVARISVTFLIFYNRRTSVTQVYLSSLSYKWLSEKHSQTNGLCSPVVEWFQQTEKDRVIYSTPAQEMNALRWNQEVRSFREMWSSGSKSCMKNACDFNNLKWHALLATVMASLESFNNACPQR